MECLYKVFRSEIFLKITLNLLIRSPLACITKEVHNNSLETNFKSRAVQSWNAGECP